MSGRVMMAYALIALTIAALLLAWRLAVRRWHRDHAPSRIDLLERP
jgi:hypothetical protein